MKDKNKTKDQLINELINLRQSITKLESSETKPQLLNKELKKEKDELDMILTDIDKILTGMKQGIAYLGANDKIIYINKQCADLFGLRYKNIIGKNIYKFHPLKSKVNIEKLINEFRKGSKFFQVTENINNRFIDTTFHRIQDDDGNYKGIVMSAFDVTERKNAEDALKGSEEKFRTFMESASDLMYMTDKDGNLTYVNEAMTKTLGYSTEELIGMHVTQLVSKEMLEKYGIRREEIIEKGKLNHEPIWIKKDGKEVYGENKIVAVYDSDGKYAGGRGVFRDITERKKAENALKESEEKFRTFMESASDLMFITDKDLNLTYVNEAMATTLGYSKEEMIGMNIALLISKESLEKDTMSKVEKKLIEKGKFSFEDIWITKDGKEVHGENKVVTVYDSDGKFAGGRCVVRDITKRKEIEKDKERLISRLDRMNEKLRQVSIIDELTGVSNRRYFEQCLEEEWNRAIRNPFPISLMIMEIDFFKLYDDNYGHIEGDRCLQKIAQRLDAIFSRHGDLFARYGGKEFAVLLPNTDEGVLYLADRCRKSIESMMIPNDFSEISDVVTISIGLSTVVPEKGLKPTLILESADKALYRARKGGRNRFEKIP
jgi:diguanylate cyclase (GGDEF)-like protein/PAS domain S-box-containing protein